MAKSKNHTNHNQSSKNHRNGIKGPMPLHLHNSKRGSWLPALVNARRVRKHNQKAALKKRRERIAAFYRFSSFKMAKSKNHTNHNQSSKNHRNGIKGPMPLHLHNSKRGSWLPALVNARRVRKHNQKAALKKRRERIAAFAAKN
ncbi:Ribosomal L29e family protein [Leishmania donovani]|nr:Ribosomal L29e family protein [Leishmania donovani]TPP48464.1 Ribosomal L29e family protein [Leishmania donovani]